jgi:hypothetical protein
MVCEGKLDLVPFTRLVLFTTPIFGAAAAVIPPLAVSLATSLAVLLCSFLLLLVLLVDLLFPRSIHTISKRPRDMNIDEKVYLLKSNDFPLYLAGAREDGIQV